MNRALSAFLAAVCACCAQAAEFCVTDSSELQAALDAAEVNGQNDVIRLAAGVYAAPAGGFRFDSATPANGDAGALTLIGGWSEFFGNPCGQQLQETPWATQIDGGNTQRCLELTGRETTVFTVRLLTFAFGHAQGGEFNPGGGLFLRGVPALGANVTIERNVFLANEADSGSGLYLVAIGNGGLGDPTIRLVNNLFYMNRCRGSLTGIGGAAYVSAGSNYDAVYISNNTVLNNSALGDCEDAGLRVAGLSRRYTVNNILWGNDHFDLFASSGSPDYRLLNNNMLSRGGAEPDVLQDNITKIAPEFESGVLNFVPARNSPLVDAGRHPVPITQWSGFYLTDKDLNAATRVVGGTVDIGAYENERIFRNGFEPSIF